MNIKYIIIIAILSVVSLNMNADETDYQPMLVDGNYWVCVNYCPESERENMGFERIEVCGDSIANGETIKKMKLTRTYMGGRIEESFFTAYERDRCVYQGVPGNSVKLMDFNYNVGDVTANNMKVVDVKYDYYNRKIILLEYGGIKHCWIEGIGSDTDWSWEGTTKPSTYQYRMFLYFGNGSSLNVRFHKDYFPLGTSKL